MFEQLKPLLLFILPASVICTLVGLLAWRKTPGRKSVGGGAQIEPGARDRNLPLVLLVPVLLIAGWSLTLQPFAWKPHATIEWMPYVLGCAGIVGVMIAVAPRMRRGLFWLLGVVACGFAIFMLSRSSLQNNRWNVREAVTWLGCGFAGTVVLLGSLKRVAQERGGASSLLFVIVGALSPATMLLSGEIKMPMLLGGVCACVGPGLIVSMVRPSYAMGALVVVPAVSFGAMWYYAITLGETPWWCAVLGTLGVLMIPISARGPLARLAGWKRWLVRGVLVALPGLVGLGILIAQRVWQPAPSWEGVG